jgi:hypothetical protein
MAAEARAPAPPVAPPAHPTYDLRAVIALALSEDAGDRGMQAAAFTRLAWSCYYSLALRRCVLVSTKLFAPCILLDGVLL